MVILKEKVYTCMSHNLFIRYSAYNYYIICTVPPLQKTKRYGRETKNQIMVRLPYKSYNNGSYRLNPESYSDTYTTAFM